jgi:hypothetical protein
VATRDASAEHAERDTDRDLAERNGHAPALVDPEDEPSAAWGWHGDFPRGKVIAGWVSVAILIAFNFTNNNADGYTQNLYLCGLALLMAIGLILHARRKRTPWRR